MSLIINSTKPLKIWGLSSRNGKSLIKNSTTITIFLKKYFSDSISNLKTLSTLENAKRKSNTWFTKSNRSVWNYNETIQLNGTTSLMLQFASKPNKIFSKIIPLLINNENILYSMIIIFHSQIQFLSPFDLIH
jgi:phage-related tail protein